MFFGLFVWLLFIKKEKLKNLLHVLCAFVALVLLGILLDKIYYGKWTISFFNYFSINLIDNVASQFGVINWYSYVIKVIVESILPIGILIFITFIVVLTDSPKSLFIWVVTPLLIIHLIIPHKEVRFLFTLANFVPFIIVKGYQQFLAFFPTASINRTWTLLFRLFFLSLNAIALVPSIFAPPANGRITITKYLQDNFHQYPARVYSLQREEENPLQPYSFLRQSFYEIPNVKIYQVSNYSLLSPNMFGSDTISFLVIHKGELLDRVLLNKINVLNLKILKNGVPDCILTIQNIYDRRAQYNEYVLYSNLRIADLRYSEYLLR